MKVKLHTALKHRVLGCYFQICRNVMQSTGRNLCYIDLFSGDGVCHCEQHPWKTWEPPYLKFLKKAKKHDLDFKAIFNDKNQNRIRKLKKQVEPYKQLVVDIYNDDANTIYKQTLRQISPRQWNIFYLDPFNHSQLKFSTIKGISKHEDYDPISSRNRKPELIITFMTYTIQQYIKTVKREDISAESREKLLETIDKSLGTNAWREPILNNKPANKRMHKILLDLLLEQLGELGYDTVYFNIDQTTAKNVIYYIIFATSNPGAYRIISKQFEPYIKSIKENKWVKENFTFYKMAKAREEDIKLLDDFN